MSNGLDLECQVCGFVGLDDGSDGFFYCQRCGSQADGVRDTAVDDAFLLIKEKVGSIIQRRARVVHPEPLSQSEPLSQFWETLRVQEDHVGADDGVGPTEPCDFGSCPKTLSYEDYYSEIRLWYVMGVQIMIELQVKALVEKFNVCPVIVGMVQPIWLRFVASTEIFSDDWADRAINESESQTQGEMDVVEPSRKHKSEPHNILGKRSIMIWYQSVRKTIPLFCSLVISFLVCHLAREPILPTDIAKWTLEGNLPYFAAFVEIEKQIGPPTNACPLSSSFMFRPVHSISTQKLESMAASISHSIGLELPPVNFYVIASRYLRQLSLPVGTILPHACRIYEWSMPPELWLSANEFRLPTRACVLSILIVSIRILYNIHGFGKWETALSSVKRRRGRNKSTNVSDTDDDADPDKETESKCCIVSLSDNSRSIDDCEQSSFVHDSDDSATKPCNNLSEGLPCNLDATEILLGLESNYNNLMDTSEHSKDLQAYLQYCKNVVFAGVELSFEDQEEEQIIEDLWDFYQNKEDEKLSNAHDLSSPRSSSGPNKRPRCEHKHTRKERKKSRDNRISTSNSLNTSSIDNHSPPPTVSHKERLIRRMISNMEENRFCYIPSRVKVKRSDYLHYTRKKGDGAYTYAAHADYYILLRSCARLAKLDVRSMHTAVLSFERRLSWLEKSIDHCLKVKTMYESCELCCDDEVIRNDTNDDSMDLSKLSL